eukprot:761195-Hanusia_phi.AAC.2
MGVARDCGGGEKKEGKVVKSRVDSAKGEGLNRLVTRCEAGKTVHRVTEVCLDSNSECQISQFMVEVDLHCTVGLRVQPDRIEGMGAQNPVQII